VACLFAAFCVCINLSALAAPYQHAATGVTFPERLGTLEKGQVTDFEKDHPGLGVSVGYHGPGITVTLYIYTMGLEAVPEDLKSSTIRNHFNQVCADVMRAGERGLYANVSKISEDQVTWGDPSKTKSLHAWFTYLQNGRDRLSHLYLMGFKNHFFKVRFTYDKSEGATAEGLQKRFLRELAQILRGGREAG
jgi:hypothetical protein